MPTGTSRETRKSSRAAGPRARIGGVSSRASLQENVRDRNIARKSAGVQFRARQRPFIPGGATQPSPALQLLGEASRALNHDFQLKLKENARPELCSCQSCAGG